MLEVCINVILVDFIEDYMTDKIYLGALMYRRAEYGALDACSVDNFIKGTHFFINIMFGEYVGFN